MSDWISGLTHTEDSQPDGYETAVQISGQIKRSESRTTALLREWRARGWVDTKTFKRGNAIVRCYRRTRLFPGAPKKCRSRPV